MNESQPLDSALKFIDSRWGKRARYGVILGTGAGDVAEHIQTDVTIPYSQIPNFPNATALGHRGELVCGRLANANIIAMRGRFHLYEGYSDQQVLFPLQIMRALGVELLFISNAAGGLNPHFESGQLMVLQSHLDLMFRAWKQPTIMTAVERPLTRADMYDRDLIQLSMKHAMSEDFVLHRGVYAGLLGPTYETRAEYRFLRRIGADVAGMSTVPEVVFAAGLGMRILAFSIVANVAKPDILEPTSGQEVIDAAAVAAPRLCSLVINAIQHTS